MLILLEGLLRIYNRCEMFCSQIKSTFGQIRRDKSPWIMCVFYHIDCSKKDTNLDQRYIMDPFLARLNALRLVVNKFIIFFPFIVNFCRGLISVDE